MTRFQVWDQALSTPGVSYCRGEVTKKTCIWVRSLNHSKTRNPQSLGCCSRPLPRKTKTKKTKWTQKWKNKPLVNPHTSINDQDSTVRGTWKVKGHFTSALSTVFNTDRLNAFNPTTTIWMELSDTSIPHLSQAAEANPSSAPFRLPDSSKLQNHSNVQETLDLLHGTTKCSLFHSIPPSSLLFFRLTLRKGLQGIFLSYQKNWELHSMPGWQKSHQAHVSAHPDSCPANGHLCTHWLTQAYRLLCIKFLKFGATRTEV